ncbi:T9SS type A sorting domain-containing protein [Rudanella paleaurantiibacter]|uniref:T9SS type A sorting domain-containing protein n=1 Tax=Rudanella paleaurantiibacter TaxID=2614655 RepID=UPI001FE6F95D|nr:T9SS type A sorting domain-containing protein [Rudanella paleaurantiibacter]
MFSTLLIWLVCVAAWGQDRCAHPLSYTPVSAPGRIDWDKFPTFKLPFTIVYGGPRLGDVQAKPLQHGFSHISTVQEAEFGSLVQPQQRAIEWSGFAFGLNQPWETAESPWNNDLNAYRTRWDRWLHDASGGVRNAAGQYLLPTDILMVDYERIHETDTRILRLKTDPTTPAAYRSLPDDQFLLRYKKDITALYAEGLRFIRERADLSRIRMSTYSDTPILNTFVNVVGNSWTDWSTNPNRVHYLLKDTTSFARVGGPFYERLDYVGPSGYYYYDYPSALAPDYLAYLLFQVEANRAWTNKPVMPFVWMRFHDCCGNYPRFIRPEMAEATAIFPFFSGAKGLWLWEVPGFDNPQSNIYRPNDVYAAYESFVHGLYRLSRFADMFEGDYQLVIPKPARDLMDAREPVWRGVVKGQNLLIAAHNPYAADGATTTVSVRYGNFSRDIVLTGRQVYLCQFNLAAVTALPDAPAFSELSVSPNPTTDWTTVTFSAAKAGEVQLQVVNLLGQVVAEKAVRARTGVNKHLLKLNQLPIGIYIVQVSNGQGRAETRLIKSDE